MFFRRPQSRNARKGLLSVLFMTLAFVLSACGAKLDSVVTLEPDQSGTRVITATIPSDVYEEYLGNDATALDALFAEQTPAELSYDGLSENEAKEPVFTFTLAFDSPEDYREKLTRLLSYDGNRDEVYVDYEVYSSLFVQGVSITDSVSDYALMGWALQAVEDSGLVVNDDDGESISRNNLAEQGMRTLSAAGQETEDAYGTLYFEEIDDLRMPELSVQTTGITTGEYTRTITYELPREYYVVHEEEFDEFFASVTPEGGQLTPAGDTGTTWVLSFTSEDPADIVAWTNAALDTDDSEFAVTSRLSTADGALGTEYEVVDYFDCSNVCRGDDADNVGMASLDIGSAEGEGSNTYRPSHEPVSFVEPLSATALTATLVAAQENPQIELTYEFAAADVDGFEEALDTYFTDRFDNPEVGLSVDGETATYRVVVGAETLEDLAPVLDSAFAPSRVALTEMSGSLFSRQVYTEALFTVPDSETLGAQNVTVALRLPDSGNLDAETIMVSPAEASVEGDTYSIDATGPGQIGVTGTGSFTKWSGYLLVALPVALLLGLAAFIVIKVRANSSAALAGPASGSDPAAGESRAGQPPLPPTGPTAGSGTSPA